MTFLITVPAVMVGCLLYDLIMNTYMKFRMKRMAKKMEGAMGSYTDVLTARLAELEGKDKS